MTRVGSPKFRRTVRHEDKMRNVASILGFVMPSAMCIILAASLKSELHAATSGEVAAGIIASMPIVVLAAIVAACILNLVCTVIAVRRKEKMWKMSAIGVPLCVALTLLTTVISK